MDSVSYSLIKLNSSDTKIARVEKMRIEDDHIFIWDNVQEVIFIFSSSGDFVSKIEKLPGIKPRVPMENIRSL